MIKIATSLPETHSSTKKLQSVERSSLHDKVYKQLREAIMSGDFQPGEALRLHDLADELGTSIMPVREALKRLAAERALTYSPGRSLRVPKLTVEDLEKIYEIRFALEGLAAELAADLITVPEIKELEDINNRVRETLRQNPHANMLRDNRKFHLTLYRAANSEVLYHMVETLWLQVGPMLNAFDQRVSDFLISADYHQETIEALRRRDGKWARRTIENDLSMGFRNIRDWLSP